MCFPSRTHNVDLEEHGNWLLPLLTRARQVEIGIEYASFSNFHFCGYRRCVRSAYRSV
jgi:hypothetical protein